MLSDDLRLEFASLPPRTRTVRWADHHNRMMEYWVRKAHETGRPAYWEDRGFTFDRWQLTGKKVDPYFSYARQSICGHEIAHGPFSRAHWKYVWLAIKSAVKMSLAEISGSTYTYIDDPSYRGILVTGVTS